MVRRYAAKPVDDALLRLLCGCALSAPSKSDLQQGDILIVRDRAIHERIADMLPEMPWVRTAPVFLVFLANGRRLPQIAGWRGKPFPNDHLDAFFNATVDAAIVMTSFLRAAEAAGLGCCPISVIRDRAADVAKLLGSAGTCRAGRRHDARMAGGAGAHQRTAAAIGHACMSIVSTTATCAKRSKATTGVAPRSMRRSRGNRSAGACRNSTAGRKTRRGNTRTPQRADFGAFVRAQGFCLD